LKGSEPEPAELTETEPTRAEMEAFIADDSLKSIRMKAFNISEKEYDEKMEEFEKKQIKRPDLIFETFLSEEGEALQQPGLVGTLLNPGEILAMVASGGLLGAFRLGGVSSIGKGAYDFGTYGIPAVLRGLKQFSKAVIRGIRAPGIEKLRPATRALPIKMKIAETAKRVVEPVAAKVSIQQTPDQIRYEQIFNKPKKSSKDLMWLKEYHKKYTDEVEMTLAELKNLTKRSSSPSEMERSGGIGIGKVKEVASDLYKAIGSPYEVMAKEPAALQLWQMSYTADKHKKIWYTVGIVKEI